MWVDEMMMHSPPTPRASTTCERHTIQYECPDDLIQCEWTLESDFPETTSKEVSSEIYHIAHFPRYPRLYHLTDDIDEVSFPDSTELEGYITMEHHLISGYRDISIVAISDSSDSVRDIE